MRESSEHELAAVEAETLALVRTQIERVETWHHHYTLFEERLLPLARQAEQASEIAYANDRGTLLELITAQRAVRDAESALQDHLTEYLAAVAELEAMAGAPPPSAEKTLPAPGRPPPDCFFWSPSLPRFQAAQAGSPPNIGRRGRSKDRPPGAGFSTTKAPCIRGSSPTSPANAPSAAWTWSRCTRGRRASTLLQDSSR